MRRVLLATSLVLMVPGCFQCSWDGGGDTVMRRANGDALILCANGGYAATLASGAILEGRIDRDGAQIGASTGTSGARAFTLVDAGDGSMSSPELGAGWQTVALDQVELDHADIQCTDLEARPWFAPSSDVLPVETAFSRTVGDTTEELLLCPSHDALGSNGLVTSYQAFAGRVDLEHSATGLEEGIYQDSTLVLSGATWTKVPLTALTSGLRCR